MNAALTTATAVVTLVTVSIGLIVSLRSKQRVDQVHVLVNDRMTLMTERVEQLSNALQAAGVAVPPTPREEP